MSPAWLRTPEALARGWAAWDWTLVHQHEGHTVVYRLTREGAATRYVKLAPTSRYPTLRDEAARTRWAGAHLPVPEVVEVGDEGGTEWLVTSGLGGVDATHPEVRADPGALVATLARGLRRFHEAAPVSGCPFDFRMETALAHVRRRVGRGDVEPERDFHPEFGHLAAREALDLLESSRPPAEDLVVCHGDYCLPNVLVRGGEAVGFLDLGELGVADRWWDLAAATWSLEWNLGPGWEADFLAGYGVAADPERRTWYRLLYDLVS